MKKRKIHKKTVSGGPLRIITNPDKKYKTYQELEPVYQLAVDLRLDGWMYRDICHTLNQKGKKVVEGVVRGWFQKEGLCWFAYGQRKYELEFDRSQLFKDINKQIKDAAVEAIVTIKKNIRKGSVAAAKDILDRAGFAPESKVKHSNDPDNPIPNETVIVYIPSNGREKNN